MGIGQDFRNEIRRIANGTHPQISRELSHVGTGRAFLDGMAYYAKNYVAKGCGSQVDTSLDFVCNRIIAAQSEINPSRMSQQATAAREELIAYCYQNQNDFDALALLIAMQGYFIPGKKLSDRLFNRNMLNNEAQHGITESCNGFYDALDNGYKLGTKSDYNPVEYGNWTRADVTVQKLFALAGTLSGLKFY